MPKRCHILILLACGLGAMVYVTVLSARHREPSYQGRCLSEWVIEYAEGPSPTFAFSRVAD